jgi:hypothetical protein
VADNAFQQICDHYAEVLHDAPGARKLERLAKTAGRIPDPLLDEVASLILELNDTALVGNDISFHLLDAAFCEARYADATQFVSQLKRRLERYIDDPVEERAMRQHYKERIAWWRMALGRASELSRWPAIVLAETHSPCER